MNRKKYPVFVLLFVVLLILLGSAAYIGWFCYSIFAENQRLIRESNQNGMAFFIQNTAWNEKIKTTERKETEENNTAYVRKKLKDSFLRQDAGDLLTVVNPWNPIPSAYQPRLVELGDGLLFDERAAGALAEMLRDCKAAGGVPCPISAYRTQEYQQELFDNKVERLKASGYSADEAPDKAAESVAVPGTSEHQIGFAVDIVDEYYPELDYAQEWTGTQQWLMQHCVNYGFILRYPSEASDITGIIFEPWHYRYVGKNAAIEITEMSMTLEEYINGLRMSA